MHGWVDTCTVHAPTHIIWYSLQLSWFLIPRQGSSINTPMPHYQLLMPQSRYLNGLQKMWPENQCCSQLSNSRSGSAPSLIYEMHTPTPYTQQIRITVQLLIYLNPFKNPGWLILIMMQMFRVRDVHTTVHPDGHIMKHLKIEINNLHTCFFHFLPYNFAT